MEIKICDRCRKKIIPDIYVRMVAIDGTGDYNSRTIMDLCYEYYKDFLEFKEDEHD